MQLHTVHTYAPLPPTRGYLLELLLTKLRYATLDISINSPSSSAGGGGGGGGGGGRRNPMLAAQEGLQIIGMSATMPNVDQAGGADSGGP